jgi:hypothetical protein
VVGPDPAAGAEVTITVPQTARWRVLGLRFQLVTDATVVNRQVDLVIDDGANVVLRIEPPAVQGAGGTRGYNYGPGLPARTVLTQEFLGALPVEAVLEGGWRIRTVTALLQAADNYNGVFLWVEEWLAP